MIGEVNLQGYCGFYWKISKSSSSFCWNRHEYEEYLSNSYSWDGLLKKICFDLKGNDEYYYDIKSNHYENGKDKYDEIATDIEKEFNYILVKDRNGKFKDINDLFYENMQKGVNISRFKLYIADIFKCLEYKNNSELVELKKVRKILVQLLQLIMIVCWRKFLVSRA